MMRPAAPLILSLLIMVAGCSRAGDPQGFHDIFTGLATATSFEEIKRYYTGGTIDAVERAVRAGAVDNGGRLQVLPRFTGARWEEVRRAVTGERAVVRLRFNEHPVENMKGVEMDFRLVKDGNAWRIDMEQEITQALDARGGGGPAAYLERLRRRY